MCRTWLFKSSAAFCGCRIQKWQHLCEAVKAGRKCLAKSRKVIYKECCCSEDCCRHWCMNAIRERDDAEAVYERLETELSGQIELCELSQTVGLTLPGGDLPTDDEYAKLKDLSNRHDYLKWLVDEHAKCKTKRNALQPDEFEDPELLSDVADSSDSDM